MEESMVRITITIVGMIILLTGVGYYIRMIKKGVIKTKGTNYSKGLAIGMITCVAGGIALSELGGYHDVASYSIIYGAAVGSWIGIALEKRYQKKWPYGNQSS